MPQKSAAIQFMLQKDFVMQKPAALINSPVYQISFHELSHQPAIPNGS